MKREPASGLAPVQAYESVYVRLSGDIWELMAALMTRCYLGVLIIASRVIEDETHSVIYPGTAIAPDGAISPTVNLSS